MLIGMESQEVERKVLLILRIVSESSEPIGARIIARRMQDYGIDLTERAVRYHLKLMDERGLTYLVGRDGRLVTEHGIDELKSALVQDKVGLVLSKIEMQAFQTSFDWKTCTGFVPMNISFFNKKDFGKALSIMMPVFKAGLCTGDRVVVAQQCEQIGDLVIPEGKVALGTVCSVLVNGVLLKAGIPMDSRFGGILQIRDKRPRRFVELIHYAGSSLDPSEVFIRGKMTTVRKATRNGNGKILSNFREVPAICRPIVDEAMDGLVKAGLRGVLLMGNTSEPVCEIPVEMNKIGVILIGGLNPVAAAAEAGINCENYAMNTVVDYQKLVSISEISA